MNIIKFSSNNPFLANHFQQTYNQKQICYFTNSKKIIFFINKLNQTIEIKNHEIKFTYKCPFSLIKFF